MHRNFKVAVGIAVVWTVIVIWMIWMTIEYGFLPPEKSTRAGDVDSAFNFVHWVSLVLFLGVVGAMGYFIVRYNRKSDDEKASHVEESKALEWSWIFFPTVLVLIVFTWGFKSYVNLTVAPPNSYEIGVRGYQWNWNFMYTTPTHSFSSPQELVVPVGRPIRLVMTSQDVLHSFYVPDFRVKFDLIPNRYSYVWFEASEVGEYPVFCTEYCGTDHSYMYATVKVVNEEEFNEFLETGGVPYDELTPLELGELMYARWTCDTCHSNDGSIIQAPSFQGLFGSQRTFTDGSTAIADEEYLRESIMNPGARIVEGYENKMPGNFGTDLNQLQLEGLIAYIKSLQDQ